MKINGSLVFDASSASEIQNLRVQKYAGADVPAHNAGSDIGRAIYVTTAGNSYLANTLYIGGATTWVAIATGGNAAALQTEVDNIELTLGDFIDGDGEFVPGAFAAFTNVNDATVTNLFDVLEQLDAAISGKDALSELVDVDVTGVADNNVLQYNSATSKWEDSAIGSASGIQAYDADLDAVAALSGTGIAVRTAADTWATRSIEVTGTGLNITDGNGVAGNPSLSLDGDLSAVAGLTTTGYVVRTGDGTATTRAIVGTADVVVVTNGDGVASDTSINLATVTQGTTGDFVKVTLDGYGRVTGNTPVVAADITALVDATYVNVAGDTMTGDLSFGGTHKVTSLAAPTADNDAATKAYVDSVAAGLTWKNAVRAATTGNISLAPAPATIDGVTLVSGDRVLVKSQTAAAENGIYTFDGTDLVRAADMNTAVEFGGAAVFVQEGTTNADTGWTQTAEVATVGTDPVVFAQFSGANAYVWGVGLVNTGNTVNVNLGAGIYEAPNDAVGIDLFNSSTGALVLTVDGTTRESPLSLDGKLHLLLDATGALAQGVDGLRINSASVTNAMLVNSAVVTNADNGTNGSLALGGELEIAGDSVQGIVTSVAGSVFTITASDASATQKGVASFNIDQFAVVGGDVSLNATLDDLENVFGADNAPAGSILQMNPDGLTYEPVSPAAFADGITLADLGDVDNDVTPAAGEVLIGNTAGDAFITRKIYHLEDVRTAATTWTVTHDLGQQYCNVTVVVDDEVVIPQSITFDSDADLTVTFNTAVAGKVVVMGVGLPPA